MRYISIGMPLDKYEGTETGMGQFFKAYRVKNNSGKVVSLGLLHFIFWEMLLNGVDYDSGKREWISKGYSEHYFDELLAILKNEGLVNELR